MTSYLLEDIISHVGKPKVVYGTKGEKVKIISERGNVLIVEGKSGRFPALRSYIFEGGQKF